MGGFTSHYLAADGLSEVVQSLVEAGANVDSCGAFGETPLLLAAGQGQLKAAKDLLRAKANQPAVVFDFIGSSMVSATCGGAKRVFACCV